MGYCARYFFQRYHIQSTSCWYHYNVTNYSDEDYFHIPDSESEVDTGIYFPSDSLPEGASLPPQGEKETVPHFRGRVPAKTIL